MSRTDDFYGIPTIEELIEAVAEWLRVESRRDERSGRWAFDARVAANILAMVQRELVHGAEHRSRHATRLRSLGVSSDAELAGRIREGIDADERAGIVAALRHAVDDRLAVCDPARLAERPQLTEE